METFTLLFLIAIALSLSVELWLAWRQIRHIQQHRDAVPNAFREKISLAEHQKAADYSVTRSRFGRFETLIATVLLLIWTLGGGLNWLDQTWHNLQLSPLMTGVAVIISFMLISSLLSLPSSIYRTFVIEERFGFNKTTVKTFISDQIKGLLLSLILGIPLILLILWLMRSAGDYWWVYAWLAWTAFVIGLSWAYPKFIAPLFNKFSPLEDKTLAERIQQLLQRAGFKSEGIFVMDGSRRSGHGNAYFTGFGKNKRIVFFDTLLDSLSVNQIEAVLAHELGHFKHKHVLKGMITMTIMTLIGFAILAWLMNQAWFYQGLGVNASPSEDSIHMALLLFMLVSGPFTFFLQPIMAWRSRKHEFEADAFAAEQASADDLITALVNLYKENASTLTPDPVHSAFYDSHPPAAIRIAHLQQNT